MLDRGKIGNVEKFGRSWSAWIRELNQLLTPATLQICRLIAGNDLRQALDGRFQIDLPFSPGFALNRCSSIV